MREQIYQRSLFLLLAGLVAGIVRYMNQGSTREGIVVLSYIFFGAIVGFIIRDLFLRRRLKRGVYPLTYTEAKAHAARLCRR